MSEDNREMMMYLRDFMVSLIDISTNKDFVSFFERKMHLVLKVIVEMLECQEIRDKIKDLELALSYLWKIICAICQQNLILIMEPLIRQEVPLKGEHAA
jgi:hypothetical protein